MILPVFPAAWARALIFMAANGQRITWVKACLNGLLLRILDILLMPGI
jgi:hypothetical protein